MILEFKVKNFLSFKDEQILSFEATDDNYLEDYHTIEVKPGLRILKMAMIYGANASGKSNVLMALDFLFSIVAFGYEGENDAESYRYDLDLRNKPSEFEITFFHNSEKYNYILVVDNSKVYLEEFYYYPKNIKSLVYKRKYVSKIKNFSLEFGSKFTVSKALKDAFLFNTKNTMTIFNGFSRLNRLDNKLLNLLADVLDWFSRFDINEKDDNFLHDGILGLINKDVNWFKDFIIPNLQKADINIIDFEIKTLRSKDEKYEIFFKHKIGEVETYFSDYEESEGTILYFLLLYFLKDAIDEKESLGFDEIETSLHPDLINHYINLFLNETKDKPVQFIFTTHNIGLLDEDFVRKDIVWFTEKKEDGSTDLFSLVEFDISEDMSISKAYKMGKFGATPKLDLIY